jgi:predicted DNA-binding protein YlxM (UPF0122 family)
MKKISKSEIAKQLNISRPTLYKKLKNGEKIELPELDTEAQKLCIHFSARNSHISPIDLENILEDLQDYGLLNNEGIAFRSKYWQLFIKE